MGDIRVGTSGWNSPLRQGHLEWHLLSRAPGAPHPGRAAASTSWRFYAEHFDTVEINSTFYGVPAPATARGWAERTPPGFEFSLKLYRSSP